MAVGKLATIALAFAILFLVAVIVTVFGATTILAARCALLVLTHALIGYHPEVMIGELEVIFLLHAIIVEVRIQRHLPVFLKHLRRVAARSAVNPVELLAAALLTIVTAATPTVIVVVTTIVIQG
jgi:hypothetical protein